MSIRPWLGYTHPMFRSQSPDTGYFGLAYSNGVYVAVGAQKGWNPGNTSYGTEGTPVTAAGCAWSTDGVNWTDSRLPFVGSSTGYESLAADRTGRFIAIGSTRLDTGANSFATRITSTDGGKTWAAAARIGARFHSVVGGATGCVFVITRATDNFTIAYSSATGIDTPVQLSTPIFRPSHYACGVFRDTNFYILPRGGGVGTLNNGAWSEIAPVAYGNSTNLAVNERVPRSCIYASAGPLSVTAPVWALINSSQTGVPPVYTRDIWSAGSGGGVWSKRSTLPNPEPTTNYYAMSYNNNILFVVGDGLGMASKDGVNWQAVSLPAGAWRGVATDGTDFVCVSANGDRIKISGSSIDARIP